MSLLKQRVNLPFLHAVLFRASTDWIMLPTQIQMLSSSGNTLPDRPRINVLLAFWASLSLVKLTHKINNQTRKRSRLGSQNPRN